MAERPYETVSLQRARTGKDLWPVIEAAQYARLVRNDDPDNPEQERAIRRFGETFAHLAENWSSLPAASQAGVLGGLDHQIAEVEDAGLSVHGAVVERELSAQDGRRVRLPVAIVLVGAPMAEGVSLRVPIDLGSS